MNLYDFSRNISKQVFIYTINAYSCHVDTILSISRFSLVFDIFELESWPKILIPKQY